MAATPDTLPTAVIEQAIVDLAAGLEPRASGESKKNRREAWHFFMDPDKSPWGQMRTYWFSLTNLQPDRVRDALLEEGLLSSTPDNTTSIPSHVSLSQHAVGCLKTLPDEPFELSELPDNVLRRFQRHRNAFLDQRVIVPWNEGFKRLV